MTVFSIKLSDSLDLDCKYCQAEIIITSVLIFDNSDVIHFFEIVSSIDCLFNIKRKSLKNELFSQTIILNYRYFILLPN